MGSYIIKEGDTLANIAAEFGTTVEDIAAANNIQNVNLIYAGDELNINVPQAAPVPQPVTTNDVVDETDLSEFTEPVVEQAAPAAEPVEPRPAETYTIKDGDTLAQIARDHGTSVEELARLNNIPDVNRIYTGDVLVIRPEVEAMEAQQAVEAQTASSTEDEVAPVPVEAIEETETPEVVTTESTDTEVEELPVEVLQEEAPTEVITTESTETVVETEPVVEAIQEEQAPPVVEEAATIQEVASVEEPVVVETPAAEPEVAQTYTVQTGDTLGAIALKNGTTVEEIARLNNIQDVNVIHTGDELVIKPGIEAMQEPSATDVSATTATITDAEPVVVEQNETPEVAPVTTSQIETGDDVQIGIDDNQNKEGARPPVTQLGTLKGVYTGEVLNKMNASDTCRRDSGVLTYNNRVYTIGSDTTGNTLSMDDYYYLVGQVAGESGLDCDDMMGVCTTILNRLELGSFGNGGIKGVLQYGYWPFGKTCDKYIVYDGNGSPVRFRTAEELGPKEYAKLQNCIRVVEDAMHGVRNLNMQTVYYFGDGQRNHFSDYV